MTIARDERAALAASLHAAGPAAPTVCEGWTTHDLAAHLWLREHSAAALAGIVIPSVGRNALEREKRRRDYHDLVDAFAAGPSRLSPFALDAVDAAANAAEFLVHHEDVRRGSAGWRPRALDDRVQAWAWPTTLRLARFSLRRAGVSVVLERTDGSDRRRFGRGPAIVTVVGEPVELLLLAFGRARVADVGYIGTGQAVGTLRQFLNA